MLFDEPPQATFFVCSLISTNPLLSHCSVKRVDHTVADENVSGLPVSDPIRSDDVIFCHLDAGTHGHHSVRPSVGDTVFLPWLLLSLARRLHAVVGV